MNQGCYKHVSVNCMNDKIPIHCNENSTQTKATQKCQSYMQHTKQSYSKLNNPQFIGQVQSSAGNSISLAIENSHALQEIFSQIKVTQKYQSRIHKTKHLDSHFTIILGHDVAFQSWN